MHSEIVCASDHVYTLFSRWCFKGMCDDLRHGRDKLKTENIQEWRRWFSLGSGVPQVWRIRYVGRGISVAFLCDVVTHFAFFQKNGSSRHLDIALVHIATHISVFVRTHSFSHDWTQSVIHLGPGVLLPVLIPSVEFPLLERIQRFLSWTIRTRTSFLCGTPVRDKSLTSLI